MTADVPTLLLMIVVSSVVVSGALLVLNGSQRRYGLQYWAGALLFSALAHGLLLLFGRIPNLLTVVLGNTLLSAALAGFLLAVRRFYGLALHWWRMAALLALVAVLMFMFQNQFAHRVAITGTGLGAQAAWVLWVLLRNHPFRPDSFSRGALLLASGLGLILATMLVRGTAALLFSLDIASILQGNLVQTLTFMVSFMAMLVCSFGFVFMAKERADFANVRLAAQDALTGVANRRALMLALEHELASAARQHTPLSLLMLDIDHFKRVNDHYGHLAGDQVLRHTVAVVRQRLRAQDVFGRYGGEEFLLLLPGTDVAGAQQLAQQLCQALQAAPCHWHDQSIAVTASVGIASVCAGAQTDWETLLQAADQALYRAKDNGRNRVEVAPPLSEMHVAPLPATAKTLDL